MQIIEWIATGCTLVFQLISIQSSTLYSEYIVLAEEMCFYVVEMFVLALEMQWVYMHLWMH